jgi:2-polyprenyl-3-methyl-5-hydroxy-6-metoxy-1,4-benzoquinol methylase
MKSAEIARRQKINVINEDFIKFAGKNDNKPKFDVICMFQLLEHLSTPGPFLSKAVNLLKNDGYLIISVPSNDSILGRSFNHTLNLPPHHQTRWTDKCLTNLASLFNLRLVKIYHEPVNKLHQVTYLRENILKYLYPNEFERAINSNFIFQILFYSFHLVSLFYVHVFKPKIKGVGQSVTVVYQNYEK